MARERLQKVLAAAGVGSRRECEEIILDARVSVNGQTVSALPVLVDPEHDAIVVDGRRLRTERKVYYLLHKPKGVHCTNYDPAGRVRACDLLRGVSERVFPVGRLDADSTGLLLMTNDGELAQRLAHPRYSVPKTYRAHVSGHITGEEIDRLKKGIWLAEGKAQISAGRIIHTGRNGSVVEITLREGKNREIRRVLARLGHNVRRLMRIKIGPLSLRGLPPGGYRPLKPGELALLRRYSTEPEKNDQRRPSPESRTKSAPKVDARRQREIRQRPRRGRSDRVRK
jgi:23S rRNA pseudouridine2605 synthase